MRLLHKSRRGGHPQAGSSSSFVTSALALEGLAVGALVNGRVCLMRTYRDAVQCAVFRAVAMVCTLGNSAANRLIALRMVHGFDLLCWFAVIMPAISRFIRFQRCSFFFDGCTGTNNGNHACATRWEATLHLYDRYCNTFVPLRVFFVIAMAAPQMLQNTKLENIFRNVSFVALAFFTCWHRSNNSLLTRAVSVLGITNQSESFGSNIDMYLLFTF